MTKTKFLDVVALILIQDQKILVAQRLKADRLALKWEFPGGKIEEGESPEAALVREIKEELDIEIEINSYFMTTEYKIPPVPVRLHAYFAEIRKGEPESKVHHQIQWILIEDLIGLDFAPADIPLAEEIHNRFKH